MDECRKILEKIFEALLFAAEKHKNQRRKDVDASPYINHPIAVVYYLYRYGRVFDSDVLVAAILHDTIEDANTSPEEVYELFGERTMQLVLELTENKSFPSDVRKKLQVEKAKGMSEGAQAIRIADKISNITDLIQSPPSGWSQERKREYLKWTKKVVDQLRGINPGLEDIYYKKYIEAEKVIG